MKKLLHVATLSAAVYTGLILLTMTAGAMPVNQLSVICSLLGLFSVVPASILAVCVKVE